MTRIDGLKAAAITIALASILLFVFRYAVEASSITLRGAWARPFFYHGAVIGRIMSCATWIVTAILLYILAPLADRLPGVRSSAFARPLVFSISGAVLTIAPPLFFIAQSAIYAVKITIYGSWATEGTIFTEFGVYPHNMLLVLLPWSLCGLCLLLFARELVPNEPRA